MSGPAFAKLDDSAGRGSGGDATMYPPVAQAVVDNGRSKPATYAQPPPPGYAAQQQPNYSGQPTPIAGQALSAAPYQSYPPPVPSNEYPSQLAYLLNPGSAYNPPRGNWKDGFFSLQNNWVPTCILSFLAPCIPLAMLAKRLGFLSYQTVLYMFLALYIISYFFGLTIPIFLAAFVLVFWARRIARQKFDLPGVGNMRPPTSFSAEATECCASFWCHPCGLAHVMRHVFNFTRPVDVLTTTPADIETV